MSSAKQVYRKEAQAPSFFLSARHRSFTLGRGLDEHAQALDQQRARVLEKFKSGMVNETEYHNVMISMNRFVRDNRELDACDFLQGLEDIVSACFSITLGRRWDEHARVLDDQRARVLAIFNAGMINETEYHNVINSMGKFVRDNRELDARNFLRGLENIVAEYFEPEATFPTFSL